MFRLRLALALLFSFCFVLFLGVVLYWGSNQVAIYFQRSQTAYETFDGYERLSLEAYRYFKHRIDRLMIDSPSTTDGLESPKHRLYSAMDELRAGIIKIPALEDSKDKWLDKSAELERVANFTAFLESSEYQFDEAEKIHKQGKRDMALQALSKFSEKEIDGKFQPLIDDAISLERESTQRTREKLEALITQSHWLAILVSLLAAFFTLTSGVLLLLGFNKRFQSLLKGTDEIASGNLIYRINDDSDDEFAFLASHFNQMAQQVALQQQELRESRVLLEKKVADRTEKLHQLNEALKHMDTARREFITDISHELRTPITVIRGEAEVALRDQHRPVDDYKEALQRIAEQSIQLSKYVNDLLYLARSETANLQFEWDCLNLTELMASTIEDIQVIAQENAIAVSLTATEKPIWVKGDKHRIRQVLYILGDNACQYSNPGGKISVVLWTNDKEASFSFNDQGIGIFPQDLDHIFDRNFRGKNASRSRKKGSGLGLAMAKAILKAHSGSISVISKENSGSTFTVSIPLISTEQETLPNE